MVPLWIQRQSSACSSVQLSSDSVVSDCLQPHGPQHSRPPCPSPTPGVSQTHVHWVGDAIQPSHPLLSPSALSFPASGSFLKGQFFTWGPSEVGFRPRAVLPVLTRCGGSDRSLEQLWKTPVPGLALDWEWSVRCSPRCCALQDFRAKDIYARINATNSVWVRDKPDSDKGWVVWKTAFYGLLGKICAKDRSAKPRGRESRTGHFSAHMLVSLRNPKDSLCAARVRLKRRCALEWRRHPRVSCEYQLGLSFPLV